MKRATCEYIMWNGLPVIRKEIAEKLNLKPAEVLQYLLKKRGRQ